MLNLTDHEINPAQSVKMPTFVGILTFISRINMHVGKKSFIFQHFCEQMKFHAQLS